MTVIVAPNIASLILEASLNLDIISPVLRESKNETGNLHGDSWNTVALNTASVKQDKRPGSN